MNADRIAEVYEGSHGNPRSQELARARVHWMCRQAAGDEILDVGCSQGIVSLLLGREGRSVVGVDRETAVVAEARRRLALEEPVVRDRVSFVEAEARALPFEDGSFDTVLLGEVLEHLVDPVVVLAEARRVLRVDGRLVVTTPYGLFPYHDHKDPLYLTELLALLTKHFGRIDVELLHHYLLITGRRGERGSKLNTELLADALAVAEQRLRLQDHEVNAQRATMKRISGDLETVRASAAGHEPEIARLSAERDAAAAAVQRSEAAQTELEQRDAHLAEQLRERSERALRLEVERDHLIARAASAEATVAQLGDRVDAAGAAAEQAAVRLAKLEGERDTFQGRAAELGATLGRVQHQLEAATDATSEANERAVRLELELQRRSDALEREQVVRDQLRADLAERSAALESLTARITELERSAEDLAAERERLQERIARLDAEREADRQALEVALAQQRDAQVEMVRTAAERDADRQALEVALAQQREAQTELVRLATERDAAGAQAQQATQQLNEAQAALRRHETAAAAAAEAVQATRRERDAAAGDAEALRMQQAGLAQRVDVLTGELAGARADSERLGRELASRDEALAALQAALGEHDDANDERYRIQAELDIARADIERLRGELRIAAATRGEVASGDPTSAEEELRQELAASQAIIAAATAELDRRVDESAEQGIALQAAQTQITRLTAELRCAEESLATGRGFDAPSAPR